VIEPPGQAQNVRAVHQEEEAALQLQWDEPVLGGAATYYEVERRLAGEESSTRVIVGTSMRLDIMLAAAKH
jgi:hypothetical protein